MALRNLTDGKRVSDSLKAFEDLQREAEAILSRYQQHSSETEDGAQGDPEARHGDEAARTQDDSSDQPENGTQAAPSPDTEPADHRSISKTTTRENGKRAGEEEELSQVSTNNGEASDIDKFTSSLRALRASLREGRTPPDSAPAPQAQPSPQREHDADDESVMPTDAIPPLPALDDGASDGAGEREEDASRDENVDSPLDRVPPPTADSSPTPLPEQYQAHANGQTRKKRPKNDLDTVGSAKSFQEALEIVRDSVTGVEQKNGKRSTTAPTPKPKKKKKSRPLSDGIPKSVSEDLPKFSGKPRTRICNQCGHETKLRSPRCEKCGRVDESLGILDSVIAGDLAKVEQILLVRPHLITVRTSRHEWTLLHMAASGGNRKMVDLLISKGASVNARNRDGKTPLHYAAGKGHLNIVQALLEHHADPHVRYHDRTAADLARKNGQHDIAELLSRFTNTEA